MKKVFIALCLIGLLASCEEIKDELKSFSKEYDNSENFSLYDVIKDKNGTILYEVYNDSINKNYKYRFLIGKLGYELNPDNIDEQAMYEERLMMGNNNKFELYYRGELTFVDSTAFVGINTDNISSMFDFFERGDTLMMHFFPNPMSRKEFQEVSFYEGNLENVVGYKYGPVDNNGKAID